MNTKKSFYPFFFSFPSSFVFQSLSGNELTVTDNQIKCDLLRTMPNNERFRSPDSDGVGFISVRFELRYQFLVTVVCLTVRPLGARRHFVILLFLFTDVFCFFFLHSLIYMMFKRKLFYQVVRLPRELIRIYRRSFRLFSKNISAKKL